MTNNSTLDFILIVLISYALGNINPSILIGKLKGIDIRKEGSGNAGTTNTIRVLGLGYGIAVLVIDILKGVIAVRLGLWLGGETGAMIGFAFVILGHCFPALHGFRGGKGVAAGFGALLALSWQSGLIALAVAAVLFIIFRRMSVASIGGIIAFPAAIHYFAPVYFYFSIAAAVFLLIMHRDNIVRLFMGEEVALKIGGRKKGGHGSSGSGSNSNRNVSDDSGEVR